MVYLLTIKGEGAVLSMDYSSEKWGDIAGAVKTIVVESTVTSLESAVFKSIVV